MHVFVILIFQFDCTFNVNLRHSGNLEKKVVSVNKFREEKKQRQQQQNYQTCNVVSPVVSESLK